MAKRKKSKAVKYISKGERPNVNKKIRNAVRAQRRIDEPYNFLVRQSTYRKSIITKRGSSALKTKILDQMALEKQCILLYAKWSDVAKWSAVVQAVKTDWLGQFEEKCIKKRRLLKESLKS